MALTKVNSGLIDPLTAAGLASDAVTTAKITDANVTATKIASDAVTTAKILNANVTTAKITDANVTTAKITDANVTAAKIASDAVSTVKILNANVTTAKIAGSNITNALMADDAIGVAELSATGTASASTFLRGDNAWAAAGSGTPTLLATTNTTSGTTVTTTTLNLTTYKTLYVKLNNIGQSTDTGSNLQWMNNGGAWQSLDGSPSDTTESLMGYVIVNMTDVIPNYGTIMSPYGARGRDWNIAVTGSYTRKFTTAMMIVPATTSISFRWLGGQTFNLGQILIYGQT